MSALCPSPSASNPSFHSGAAITRMCSLSALHFDETHGARCPVSLKEHFRAEQHLTRAICLCSWILWCPAARLCVPRRFVNHAVLKCPFPLWPLDTQTQPKKCRHFSIYTICFVLYLIPSSPYCIKDFDVSYLQLCGDTPADVHHLFQGQVEVHTVKYCIVPLPRVVLLHSLRVCFLWREGQLSPERFHLVHCRILHFAKHQVQKLQCRRSWPPLHIPLYIFDVFALFSYVVKSACVHEKQNSWGVQYLFWSFYYEMSCLDLPGSCVAISGFAFLIPHFNLSFFFLLLSGWTTWLNCSKSGSAWIFLSFPFAVLCYSRWESDGLFVWYLSSSSVIYCLF